MQNTSNYFFQSMQYHFTQNQVSIYFVHDKLPLTQIKSTIRSNHPHIHLKKRLEKVSKECQKNRTCSRPTETRVAIRSPTSLRASEIGAITYIVIFVEIVNIKSIFSANFEPLLQSCSFSIYGSKTYLKIVFI